MDNGHRILCTHKLLYNTVCYNTILDKSLKMDPKMYKLYREMTINGHFSI